MHFLFRCSPNPDITQVDKLLHGNENVVCADAGYTGVEKRPEHAGREVIWQVAARRSTYKKLDKRSALYKAMRKIEKAKAQVRAKVEHPFRVIKRQFGYVKVRFRGLAKNTAQLVTLFALSNLWMARRHLLTTAGKVHLLCGKWLLRGARGGQKRRTERVTWSILIDGPLSKAARAEVDRKYRVTSDLPLLR